MANLRIRWEKTGEHRPPRKGEWFRDGNTLPTQAFFDFSNLSYDIVTMVVCPMEDEPQNQ